MKNSRKSRIYNNNNEIHSHDTIFGGKISNQKSIKGIEKNSKINDYENSHNDYSREISSKNIKKQRIKTPSNKKNEFRKKGKKIKNKEQKKNFIVNAHSIKTQKISSRPRTAITKSKYRTGNQYYPRPLSSNYGGRKKYHNINDKNLLTRGNFVNYNSQSNIKKIELNNQQEKKVKSTTLKKSSSTLENKEELNFETKKLKEDEIEIHVFDQSNKKTKHFVCKKDLLLKEMKYFEVYFSNTQYSFEDIDISVHCDIHIFKWLMDYIKIKDELSKPKLAVPYAVSILISSDFLKMKNLVKISLNYVKENLQEILKLPIDLECINMKLLRSLTKLFTIEELNEIKDKRGKIIDKLFLIKLEKLINDQKDINMKLSKCIHCSKIFCTKFKNELICKKSKSLIDFNGRLISRHKESRTWNINKFLINLGKRISFGKKLYWQIWGIFNHFFCSRCDSLFPAVEIEFCSFHPKEPLFKPFTNVGIFPCCNKRTYRFDSSKVEKTGCRPRSHIITTNKKSSSQKGLEKLITNKKYIMSTYGKVIKDEEDLDDIFMNDNDDPNNYNDLNQKYEFSKFILFNTFNKYSGFKNSPVQKIKMKRKSKYSKFDNNKKSTSVGRRRFFNTDCQRYEDANNISNILKQIKLNVIKEERKIKKRKKKNLNKK